MAVWKKRTGIPRRVASMPSGLPFVRLPAAGGAVEDEVLRAADEVEREHVVAAPAVGEAHVRPVEALDRLGHREPRLPQQPRPLRRSRDSSSRASIPEHAGELARGRGLEEPRYRLPWI